ncbi:MAG: hypothetical protein JSS83_12810 [Cyanobacteria bacterium SZAS LIN-3]|nr:hypothetical protein [Cyanobacteria bacterium SZAS LIN-3]
MKKKLPRYNYIGVTLLGRLAVAKEFSHAKSPGLRAGELLLSDAKLRSYIASKTVASYAVIVDILIGEKGDPTNFYKRYDFVEFPSNPRKLYLPMATVEKTVNKAGLI